MKIVLISLFVLSIALPGLSQDLPEKFSGCEVDVGGKWIPQSKGTRPFIVDSVAFDQLIKSKIRYPSYDKKLGLEGEVFCWIEIDKLGEKVTFSIDKNEGPEDMKLEIAKVLGELPISWIPASMDSISYDSRVRFLFKFSLDGPFSFKNGGKYYKAYVIMVMEGGKQRIVEASKLRKKKKK